MASQEVPAAMADQQHQGSLLTLFLFNPTMAFFYVCNLDEVRSCVLLNHTMIIYDLIIATCELCLLINLIYDVRNKYIFFYIYSDTCIPTILTNINI